MSKQWCDYCKKTTVQKNLTNNKSGNDEYRCSECGMRNYTIQGFNWNLM